MLYGHTASISSAAASSLVQIYSSTCTAPVTVYCSTIPSIQIPVSLTVGNTYLIRVYSNTNATGTFNICITDPVRPRYGNSYVNVSKRTNGGVVENGDTPEIRMTIHITSVTIYNARYLVIFPLTLKC